MPLSRVTGQITPETRPERPGSQQQSQFLGCELAEGGDRPQLHPQPAQPPAHSGC